MPGTFLHLYDANKTFSQHLASCAATQPPSQSQPHANLLHQFHRVPATWSALPSRNLSWDCVCYNRTCTCFIPVQRKRFPSKSRPEAQRFAPRSDAILEGQLPHQLKAVGCLDFRVHSHISTAQIDPLAERIDQRQSPWVITKCTPKHCKKPSASSSLRHRQLIPC